MKKSLLTLGLGFGLGFSVVSFFVGTQRVEAEILGRVRSHQARMPLSQARAESFKKNYFQIKKSGKTKRAQSGSKVTVVKAKPAKKVKSQMKKNETKKKPKESRVRAKAKKPLVLDFTT